MAGWFYNSVSGALNKVPTLAEGPYFFPGAEFGWHELKIPYTSTRQQAINAARLEYPKGANPGGSLIGNAAQASLSSYSPIGSIGDFFHRLTEKETWIRVAEFAGGGILLVIGVRAMAHGSPTVGTGARQTVSRPAKKATKTAVKVAKVAITKKPPPKAPPRPPAQRPPTVRVSHIVHHVPNKPPKATTKVTTKKPKAPVKP